MQDPRLRLRVLHFGQGWQRTAVPQTVKALPDNTDINANYDLTSSLWPSYALRSLRSYLHPGSGRILFWISFHHRVGFAILGEAAPANAYPAIKWAIVLSDFLDLRNIGRRDEIDYDSYALLSAILKFWVSSSCGLLNVQHVTLINHNKPFFNPKDENGFGRLISMVWDDQTRRQYTKPSFDLGPFGVKCRWKCQLITSPAKEPTSCGVSRNPAA